MICKYCGKQIEDNSKFCPYCGKELSSTSTDKFEKVTANSSQMTENESLQKPDENKRETTKATNKITKFILS